MSSHMYYSKVLAALAFGMAFLLTPRAMVESSPASGQDTIPVQTLETSGDCLWCQPDVQPVRCDSVEEDSEPEQELWLNPDAPPSIKPCVPTPQEEVEDSAPSA